MSLNIPPWLTTVSTVHPRHAGNRSSSDADFGRADFYVLLSLDRVDPRYLRHFLGRG
ncbi:hypothetical protein GCM10010199_23260 [Dactylosporangium roseum]